MMVPIDSTAHHHSGSNSRKWAGSNEILAVPSLGRDSGIAGRPCLEDLEIILYLSFKGLQKWYILESIIFLS